MWFSPPPPSLSRGRALYLSLFLSLSLSLSLSVLPLFSLSLSQMAHQDGGQERNRIAAHKKLSEIGQTRNNIKPVHAAAVQP